MISIDTKMHKPNDRRIIGDFREKIRLFLEKNRGKEFTARKIWEQTVANTLIGVKNPEKASTFFQKALGNSVKEGTVKSKPNKDPLGDPVYYVE
jgi:hypothetical protein